MGNGKWKMGNGEWEMVNKEWIVKFIQCSDFHFPFTISHSPFPIFHFPFPISHSPFTIPYFYTAMIYRKFSADQLFDGYRLRDSNSVLITTSEGVIEDIVPKSEAGEDIQQLTGILSPGFINCHCHLELSHMKGAIPEKTGLVDFVFAIIRDRHYSEESILAAIDKAESEMIANGIVAVGDICNNILTIPQKIKGNLYYHNFIEASGFLPQLAVERFQRAVNIYNEYTKHSPEISNSTVPHAPYSVSEVLWEKIIGFPGNKLMTIHNQETEDENQFFQEKQGKFTERYDRLKMDISFFHAPGTTSLRHYLSKFPASQSLILVHNVCTGYDDIQYSRQSETPIHWCLCPNANEYITGELPDISLLREQHCNIVLGTDSLASNHQLNILSEIQTIKKHYPSIPLQEYLQWATINGAKALQLDHLLGSFEKGKKPGILLCDPELTSCKRLG